MAIQTVIPGRKSRRDLLLEQYKTLRDRDEDLALEKIERQEELNRIRDPNIDPSEVQVSAEALENRIESIDNNRKSILAEVSSILETPVEELEGFLPGVTDEQLSTAVDQRIRENSTKNIIGSGTPIQLDRNDNIVDPITGEPVDYSGAFEEQVEAERQLIEESTIDLSPEYMAEYNAASPFKDIISDTEFSKFFDFANEIKLGLEATQTRIPNQREAFDPAMKTVRELLEVPESMNNYEVSNSLTLAMLTVAEGAYGKMVGPEVDQDNVVDMEQQAQDFEDLKNLDLEVLEGGGINRDSFINMLKSQIQNRLITQPIINEEGLRIQKKPIDEDALEQATEVAIASMINNGIIREGSVSLVQEKVNGRMRDIIGYNPQVPVYFVDTKVYDVVRGAKTFIRLTDRTRLPKKASIIPGGKRAALINQGVVYGAQKGKAAQKYEDTANNVAFFINNQALAFVSTMQVITDQIRQNPESVIQINQAINGLPEIADAVLNTKLFVTELGLTDQELTRLQQARNQEEAMSRLAIGDATQIFVRGMQVFPQHTTDLMNMRLRNTEMDMNPQRSKIHRGIVQSGRPLNVNVTFKNRTLKADESYIPKPIIDQIDTRVKKEDYKPLTEGEKEASHLFAITHNLLQDITGIDPSGLTEKSILSYITPNFLEEAAKVGRILNRAFPKDLKAEDFQDVDMMQARVINGLLKLLPEEQAELTRVFSQMTKGDWGYKFKSYIAAADYLDSTGNSVTSNVTLEYDYNSAGLSFMQTDAGRTNFLSMVGIISEHKEEVYKDALKGNSPRNLFLDKIIQFLQTSEISSVENTGLTADAQKVAQALSNAKLSARSKNELIRMAKGILLTIGYAKPAMFQHDNIRDVLQQVPELAILETEGVDVVNILNYAVSQSVRNIIETKFATKVKQATRVLTMMGIPPHLETDDGQKVPMYKTKRVPIEGATPIEVVSQDGKVTLVAQKEKVPNLREQSRPKTTGEQVIIPPTTASVSNRPGAISGQSRETMSLRDAVNVVNKDYGREQVPVFFETVFDNIITNAEGAFYYRAAMNGVSAKNALAFNNTSAFLYTAAKEIARFSEVIPPTVEINKKTDYGALLEEIQLTKMRYEGNENVDDLAQEDLNEKTRPRVKKFLDYLANNPNENIRKLYETDITSDETIILSRQEFAQVMANYLASVNLNILSFQNAAKQSEAAGNQSVLRFENKQMKFAG